MSRNSICAMVVVQVVLVWPILRSLDANDYDPLILRSQTSSKPVDITVKDGARNREIPLRVYLPAAREARPVVLFSHGLGGTRKGSAFLGEHWSARGYVAVFLQHPGSDDSVWKDQPLMKRMSAMTRAASLQNFLLRVRDVSVVLDQLEQWKEESGHVLHERLDLARTGMSGHSFGAVTTQAVGGQTARMLGQRFADKRIRAALVLSPSCPKRIDPATAFGAVKIPWLLMTGTEDKSLISASDVTSRRKVYPNLPASIDKYELVLYNAEHSVFTERALPGDKQRRNPNHHRAILALTTAFWDTYLRDDLAARKWLQGPAARKVLESRDRWQRHVASEK